MATGELATQERSTALAGVKHEPLSHAVEAALATGDLSKLSTEHRVEWYRRRCRVAGLDPATKPFEYITLQGKLTLYATKACTDQLNGIHGISHFLVSRTDLDGGVHEVVVRAVTKGGRETTEIGGVPTVGLRGAELANARMKAITKAKRRATLSLCGLGDVIDETELETVADVRPCDDKGTPLPPQNNSGFGRGQYASPEQTEAYLEAFRTYLDRRNTEYLDAITGEDGTIPPAAPPYLANEWQADGHLVKWAKATGRLDAVGDEQGIARRQVGRYTAIVYHRSKADRIALTTELARYLDEQARLASEKIAASERPAIEADEGDDDIPDDLTDSDVWPQGKE